MTCMLLCFSVICMISALGSNSYNKLSIIINYYYQYYREKEREKLTINAIEGQPLIRPLLTKGDLYTVLL